MVKSWRRTSPSGPKQKTCSRGKHSPMACVPLVSMTLGDRGVPVIFAGPAWRVGLLTAVRAENLIRGSDQHSCSRGALPVMLTGHVPAVRFAPDHATLNSLFDLVRRYPGHFAGHHVEVRYPIS